MLVAPRFQTIAYAITGGTCALLYWSLWGWVLGMARRRLEDR